MLKEASFSFNSDLKPESNPVSFLEFWIKVFQIEIPLHEKWIWFFLVFQAFFSWILKNCWVYQTWKYWKYCRCNIISRVEHVILTIFNFHIFNVVWNLENSKVLSKRIPLFIIHIACFCWLSSFFRFFLIALSKLTFRSLNMCD